MADPLECIGSICSLRWVMIDEQGASPCYRYVFVVIGGGCTLLLTEGERGFLSDLICGLATLQLQHVPLRGHVLACGSAVVR